MAPIKDMTGKKFAMLTVIESAGLAKNGEMTWRCRCDCGNEIVTKGSLLRSGTTRSCGCYHKIATQKFRKFNTFTVNGNVVIVDLPGTDKKMLCDLEDWETLGEYSWRLSNQGYATTNIPAKDGAPKKSWVRAHTLIIEKPSEGFMTDHINRNKLDNRKSNLRIVSARENILNRNIFEKNKYGIRGVQLLKNRNKKWTAKITVNNEIIHLGYFYTLDEAKKARLDAEEKYLGGRLDG